MIGSTVTTYALRSLLRNPRRTVLSVLGVGVGCAIGIIGTSFYGGAIDWQIRAASESGVGHLLVVNERWTESRENALRVRDWRTAAEVAGAEAGVTIVTPRTRARGLLALGNRARGAEVVGVAPESEFAGNRTLQRATIAGRYLEPDETGSAVIGRGLAAALGARLDDQLVITLSGPNEIQSGMLTVVGILETGLESIDEQFCHVALDDVRRLTEREGVGEIGITLSSRRLIDEVRARLALKLPAGCRLITWGEVMTLFAMNIESDTTFVRFVIFIVMLVVGLFVMSAQHAAVLERRREFAVLSALGMRARRVIGLVLVEGLFTGLLGAVAAIAIGGGLAFWMSGGIDMAKLFGNVFDVFGVVMDPVINADVGVWIVWYALTVCTLATTAASVIPAWKATKVDPAEALRGV
jgi:ABC-type lipoprotein release transport system permease subunit